MTPAGTSDGRKQESPQLRASGPWEPRHALKKSSTSSLRGFQRQYISQRLTTKKFWKKLLVMKGHKESLTMRTSTSASRSPGVLIGRKKLNLHPFGRQMQGDMPGANLLQQGQSGKKHREVPPLPILFCRFSFLLAVPTQPRLLTSQHSTHTLKFYLYCSEDFEQSHRKLFSTLRYATCTAVGMCRALPEPRNKVFNNIFDLSPQHSVLVRKMRQACLQRYPVTFVFPRLHPWQL